MLDLAAIYGEMNTTNVPNVNQLKHCNQDRLYLVFQPVGIHAPVLTPKALLSVLRDVLESLVVQHNISLVHRDIRWDNVMKLMLEDKWFIIDFDEAMKYPCANETAKHLNKRTHAPEMFIDGKTHVCSVDIWGVGYLIKSAYLTCTAEMKYLMDLLMNPDPKDRPKAVDALNGVKSLIICIAD